MKRVLVTGADGFIGSHLTEELVRGGSNVRALVQYNSFGSWGWLDSVPRDVRESIEVVSGDLRDPVGVKDAIRGCSAVLHLAALIAIPYSYRAPFSYVETNVTGTLNVMQGAREEEVEKVVHTSTSEVYGSAQYVPIDESHPLVGQSPYSASKIGADQIAFSYFASFGLPVVTLRPFNTYGPRQSARAVIPTIISQLASGSTELRLGALTPTRDFSYVSDTVAGFVAALKADGAVGEVVNLGTGHEVSIRQTAELIAELMGVSATFIQEEERNRPVASEVQRLLADNRKAQGVLGWRPKFAGMDGLRFGLAETIRWFTEPGNLERYKVSRFNL